MGGCAWRYGKERVGSGEGLGPERVQAADAEIDRDVVLSQRAVERLERRPSFLAGCPTICKPVLDENKCPNVANYE